MIDYQKNELNIAEIIHDINDLKKKTNSLEREMYTKLFSDDFKKF